MDYCPETQSRQSTLASACRSICRFAGSHRPRFVSALLLGCVLTFAGCKRDKPVIVQTDKATRRTVIESVTATGKIQPFLQVKISPEVAGEIVELPVKEGQHVRKGELLVKIRRDFYEASRNSAEASRNSSLANLKSTQATLLSAESQARKAEAELKRNTELFEKKLVSESVYDDFRTAFEAAQSQRESSRALSEAASHQIQMAGATLKKAEEDLLKTTIYSPIDGTISKLNAEVGERVVGTGMMAGTEIMTVADLNEMEARVEVGEVDVIKVGLGQHASLEVDSFGERKFNGSVTQIGNSAKTSAANTQQEATKFEVRIRVTEKDPFRPGMSVTAKIETASRTNVLTVPFQCVTTRLPLGSEDPKAADEKPTKEEKEEREAADQLGLSEKQRRKDVKPIDVVFTVDHEVARMLPVKRGISDENYYEIIEGISDGKEIVTGSFVALARELADGKRVKIDNSPPKRDSKK